MASCCCFRQVLCSSSNAQGFLVSSSSHRRAPLSAGRIHLSSVRNGAVRGASLRLQGLGFIRHREGKRWSINCSAAGMGAEDAGDTSITSEGQGPSESPYQTLGVSPLEKFEVIKGVYGRKRKDAEKRGDEITVERLDKAYDRIMMMQLSNRKQGLAFGGQFEVSKEIKYADKRSWIPWGPKRAPSERREVLINLAITAVFCVWVVAAGGQTEWKPLQFLIFGYIFRIFNKLKEYEPAGPSSYASAEEEGEDGGGGGGDSDRRLKNGKRLLRTLGLVFSCVALASLAFTGTLNAYELLGQYIPKSLMGAQELFVTTVSAVSLFFMASYFR